jgi:sentrin-specific protease 7
MERRDKVHAFSCLFYTKLIEAKDSKSQHQLVSRWTKNINLFEKEFILFPINLNYHWSLMVIARPKLWVQEILKKSSQNSSSGTQSGDIHDLLQEPSLGCFLHLDSLNRGGHRTEVIVNNLGRYLLHENHAQMNRNNNCTSSESAIIPNYTLKNGVDFVKCSVSSFVSFPSMV